MFGQNNYDVTRLPTNTGLHKRISAPAPKEENTHYFQAKRALVGKLKDLITYTKDNYGSPEKDGYWDCIVYHVSDIMKKNPALIENYGISSALTEVFGDVGEEIKEEIIQQELNQHWPQVEPKKILLETILNQELQKLNPNLSIRKICDIVLTLHINSNKIPEPRTLLINSVRVLGFDRGWMVYRTIIDCITKSMQKVMQNTVEPATKDSTIQRRKSICPESCTIL